MLFRLLSKLKLINIHTLEKQKTSFNFQWKWYFNVWKTKLPVSGQRSFVLFLLFSMQTVLCSGQSVTANRSLLLLIPKLPWFLFSFHRLFTGSRSHTFTNISFLLGCPQAFGGIAPQKGSNHDKKWLLPHHKAKHHVAYRLGTSLNITGGQNWPQTGRWNQITLDLSFTLPKVKKLKWTLTVSELYQNYEHVLLIKFVVC